MAKPLRLLVYLTAKGGVGYHRLRKPAEVLQRKFPERFQVEFIQGVIDWDKDSRLEGADLIIASTTIAPPQEMEALVAKLKDRGIKVVLDIDDYWSVTQHPLREMQGQLERKQWIPKLMGMVAGVSVSTEILGNFVRPHVKGEMAVLPNGVDPLDEQFSPRKTDKPVSERNGILWCGGASHMHDMELLQHTMHDLAVNFPEGMQVQLAGFNLNQKQNNQVLRDEVIDWLRRRNQWTPNVVTQIKAGQYKFPSDLTSQLGIPSIFILKEVPVAPIETLWAGYERIITNNYRIIQDPLYKQWLTRFDLEEKYEGVENQPYRRIPTKPVEQYAHAYRNARVALAPLKIYEGKTKKGSGLGGNIPGGDDNIFQSSKSPLKLIEAAFHKVPVIATACPTYENSKFVDGESVVFVQWNRTHKDWFKKMNELLINPKLAEEMGEAAYQVALENYDLNKLVDERGAFYELVALK